MKIIELMKYARVPLELNGKKGDEVLILADSNTEPLVYESFAAACYEMEMEPTVIIIVPRKAHGHEPTKPASSAMENADLIISAATTAMTHTDAIRNALKAGKKFISMPGINVDMLTHGAATADYKEVQQITSRVAKILTEGKEVRIVSDEGTDVTMSINGRPCFVLAGIFQPGTIACFPDGEAAMAPVEGTANGRIVFDLSIHSIGLLKTPVQLSVENGLVTKIDGGQEARELQDILTTRGNKDSFMIGELAVGTNAKARITGNVSEDKKRIGTIHIGLGDNYTLAGKVRCPTHLDGIISMPTMWVDGKILINKGILNI